MAKSGAQLITLLRNVTGRIDSSDPLFDDNTMLGYINDFLSLNSTQDIRMFQNRTWWEFTIDQTLVLPKPVVLDDLVLSNGSIGASTIGPLAYADGFEMFWFQDPGEFYRIWPETQTYATSRPTYVLYYNNQLTFRNPPNQTYNIKISAYQVQLELADTETNLNTAYLYRYVAYGAALDIFSDYGEMEKYNEIYPVFMKYRGLVYGRTHLQYQNQRAAPEF